MEPTYDEYINWIMLRNETKNKEGKLCYCGHTHKCDCSNPDFECFKLAVKNGNIILNSPTNRWTNYPTGNYMENT